MALTVKHLNSDASFLLSFEPIIPESIADSVIPQPFTILLDPWITGPSTIFHPKISTTSHKRPACISSLTELLQPPDLVIISQHKSDHCNEATLRQLPASGTSTLILAEPASARVIRSWKYFDKEKIRTIVRWEDPRITGKQSVIRIPVPSLRPGSGEGEVTVAFIPQKRDLAGLHGAIGITYRPPPTQDLIKQGPQVRILTPPLTPESHIQKFVDAENKPPAATSPGDTFLLPPTPPISPILPRSLRSIRSASTLIASPTLSPYSPTFRPVTSSHNEKTLPLSAYSHSRPISLIFSPHGIPYSHLSPYATSHLVAEAALPLTALLHCMDSISNPWWLGGNICAGVPYGAEIAAKLGARVWISAHDGEKDIRGLATGMLKTRRWRDEEIEGALESGLGDSGDDRKKLSRDSGPEKKTKGAPKTGGTDILRLNCGGEILVSGTGRLWRNATDDDEIQPNVDLAVTEPASPPAPTNQTLVKGIKHQGKYYKKAPEALVLPKVQDSMSPQKPSVYMALRTKDLIKPSPKLTLEQDVTTFPSSEPKPMVVQGPFEGIDQTVPKRGSSDDGVVRVELST
ncbi:hypothetical protein HD806DRAFT_284870 [Xylariaceae sp. AK1471]|nr:hypothetical protein HD806DRAFT_284870 [Xylariaceae sp. AK1471]